MRKLLIHTEKSLQSHIPNVVRYFTGAYSTSTVFGFYPATAISDEKACRLRKIEKRDTGQAVGSVGGMPKAHARCCIFLCY